MRELTTSFTEMLDNLDDMPVTVREYAEWPNMQWTTTRTPRSTMRTLNDRFGPFWRGRYSIHDGQYDGFEFIVAQFRRWIRRAKSVVTRRHTNIYVVLRQVLPIELADRVIGFLHM